MNFRTNKGYYLKFRGIDGLNSKKQLPWFLRHRSIFSSSLCLVITIYHQLIEMVPQSIMEALFRSFGEKGRETLFLVLARSTLQQREGDRLKPHIQMTTYDGTID